MWYKCLNSNCGFVFTRTTECDRCPDCGKQHLREATNEDIESVKSSLDDVIAIAESRKQPPTNCNKPKPEQRSRGERRH